MNRMRIRLGIIIALIFIVSIILYLLGINNLKDSTAALGTTFSYTKNELSVLDELTSGKKITQEEVALLSARIREVVAKHSLPPTLASKVYAYYFSAQRDFLLLSAYQTHEYQGTLTEISNVVICEFVASECNGTSEDAYSKALTNIIMGKVKARTNEEKQNVKTKEPLVGEQYWIGENPVTPDAGTWKTWLLSDVNEFMPAPPPIYNSTEDMAQVREVLNAVNNLTGPQIDAVKYWAGGKGTATPAGIWLEIADQHIAANKLSLVEEVNLRARLSQAIADAFIACWNAKFTYYTKRPFMRDSRIKPVIPTPNFPSYTSGHSTISATASTVLSYYFPEKAVIFAEMASNAKNSRLWAGIHFPVDNEIGAEVGQKIGREVVKAISSSRF